MLEDYVKKAVTAATKEDLIEVLLDVVNHRNRASRGYSNYSLEELNPVVESVKAIVLSHIDLIACATLQEEIAHLKHELICKDHAWRATLAVNAEKQQVISDQLRRIEELKRKLSLQS